MAARAQPTAIPEDQTPIPGGGESKGPPPKFGTQKPVEGAGGEVPRVVDPLERYGTVKGVTRFKIRCSNYHPQKTRYILARNDEEARAHYLEVNGLAKELERLKKNGVEKPEQPDLVVTALPD